MENQQNESNTLIAWVVGAAVTAAIAIAFIFSAVAVNASGSKPASAAAPSADAGKTENTAAPAAPNAPAQSEASQPKSD